MNKKNLSSKRKRILVISPAFYPVKGGLSEQATLLARAISKIGYDVDVLTEQLGANLPQTDSRNGVNIYRIKQLKQRRAVDLICLALNELVFICRRPKYDGYVIRSVTSHAVIFGLFKLLGIIRSRTMIFAETGDQESEISDIKKMKFHKLFIFLLKRHDVVNANNSHHERHYRSLGFEESKITKIYNGIEIDKKKRYRYPTIIRRFCFLGELKKYKGIYELLEAYKMLIKEFPEASLEIGGFGEEEAGVTRMIDSIGSHNLKYSGYIKKRHKEDFFGRCDCLVLPSHTEGFGLVAIEAAAHKKAIISTDVGDVKKIFGNRIVYAKRKNAFSLYKSMKKMIKDYDSASLSYEEIIEKFDITQTAKQVVAKLQIDV